MKHRFVYVEVVLAWATTRRFLFWRITNSLTADFCVEALARASDRVGSQRP